MSNLELYMTATERTEDTEGKYSVLSVFSVAKSYKKHTRFSILNLTFKDVVKNIIKQPNQCMTYQNINSLAIDLPTFT